MALSPLKIKVQYLHFSISEVGGFIGKLLIFLFDKFVSESFLIFLKPLAL